VSAPRGAVNPYCFEQAIAPHIAADINRKTIKIKEIIKFYARLSALADVVIVEGAGGFCVPLNGSETSADLARELALPVVLVVGMRLGCLNHALLTAEAIRARGLVLAGWVANHIDADMPYADENVAALHERLAAPLLVRIAFGAARDVVTVTRQWDSHVEQWLRDARVA
jgi:dethiobiotin synthetase